MTDDELQALLPALAEAAQQQYLLWQQDSQGQCPVNGVGGICHHVAESMCAVLGESGLDSWTLSASDEVHVFCVCVTRTGVWSVDVPWRHYERGGGHQWTKLPDVELGPQHVALYRLDTDPDRAWMYRED